MTVATPPTSSAAEVALLLALFVAWEQTIAGMQTRLDTMDRSIAHTRGSGRP